MPGIANTMREFGKGQLHSGSKTGKKVTNRKQAVAIALNSERKAKGQPAKKPTDVSSIPSLQGLAR